jgi:hypothetical protein
MRIVPEVVCSLVSLTTNYHFSIKQQTLSVNKKWYWNFAESFQNC